MEKDWIDKLYVIGGSSGSLDVLLTIFPLLQPLRNAAMIVVLHRKNSWDSMLPEVFSQRSSLFIKEAEEKEKMKAGWIYIAPADYHLLIEKDGSLSLDVSEKINFSRPSIDVCMETAAEAYHHKVIGILLSGANADGVIGLQKIKQCGGFTIAQNPASADFDYMPKQAIERGVVSAVLLPKEMADYINRN
jgi:two-component system chemotaxis response regulator CheB